MLWRRPVVLVALSVRHVKSLIGIGAPDREVRFEKSQAVFASTSACVLLPLTKLPRLPSRPDASKKCWRAGQATEWESLRGVAQQSKWRIYQYAQIKRLRFWRTLSRTLSARP